MALNKITAERNQKILLELAAQPGNDVCADCKVKNPRWASHNLGIFICVNCASVHRKIGTHVTKVKSVTMDSWTKEQLEVMRQNGNIKSNQQYNPNETRHPPPPNLMDGERDSEMEQYIRSKYEYKSYVDRSAFVASKLGPSRSASSVAPRSAKPAAANNASTSSAPAPPARANTAAPTTTAPMLPPARSFSQPLSSAPMQQSVPQMMQAAPMQQQPPAGGVWNDLISLQGSSSGSSLPLQYQPSLQAPPSTGYQPQMTMNTTGLSMPMNPFTPQYTAAAPQFAPSAQPFAPVQQFAPSMSQFTPSFAGQPTLAPQMQASTPLFNPQPQAFPSQQPMFGMGTTPSPIPQQAQNPAAPMGYQSPAPAPSLTPTPGFGGPQMLAPNQFGSPSPHLQMQPTSFMQQQPAAAAPFQPGQFMPMGSSPQPFNAGGMQQPFQPQQQQQQWMGATSPMGYPQQQGQWGTM